MEGGRPRPEEKRGVPFSILAKKKQEEHTNQGGFGGGGSGAGLSDA